MSFLFPLYLLGAAALAVPIFLHLRRRPPKEHVPFSSHMFLEKSPDRLTRRTRLERWILLALRCLALLLLAFAFGRPFLQSLPGASTADNFSRTFVLVDRSASMQREDLWQQALELAKSEIVKKGVGDEIGVAFFDDQFELIVDLPAWASLSPRARTADFNRALEEAQTKPSWRPTDLGLAMARAADRLLAADISRPATSKELIVISDFQTGADQKSLQNEAWPEDVNVRCLALAPKESGNLSINLAATPDRANIDEDETYRVRIRNAADSDSASAVLSWKGFPETAIETSVAPGTSRILRSLPRPAGAERGTLLVAGDAHPFDNEVYVSPVQARPLRVLVTGDTELTESAGSPLFYLKRALQPTPILTPVVTTAESLIDVDLSAIEVIVVIDKWTTETGIQLMEFAEAGGLVLAIPSADAAADALAALVDSPEWVLSESPADDYALLADLDFEHPVLEPFARAQIRDFTKIRFWKHRELKLPKEIDASTRILATFDGESPALIEKRIGDGTVFAFLSGWEPRESQLALSSKFVPLLFSIFNHTGFSIRSAPTLYVEETEASEPGFQEIEEEGSSSLLAVNLNPREGETSPFDPAVVFAEWGIPLINENEDAPKTELTEEQLARLKSEEKEQNQKLWKWIILAALVVLMIESGLAGHRPQPTGGNSDLSPEPTS